MSRASDIEMQLQNLIFSVNPNTGRPYAKDSIQTADGQGTRVWGDIFQTISSQATFSGVGSVIGYMPSTYLQLYNGNSNVSSIVSLNFSNLSSLIAQGGIPGSITSLQLQSTVSWVQTTSKYISTGDLTSSMTPFLNGNLSFMSNIQSTVIGLGSATYISSPTLLSTSVGGNSQLYSTVRGLGSVGYISTLSLQSTVQNLGQASYISSSALISTATGILYPNTSPGGSLGVIVTGTSDPPFINFNTLITQYLTSTKYINQSNADFYGIVNGSNLPSTTVGLISSLGSRGYVSTQTLLSTSAGIQAAKQNIFIDRSGATNIINSQVTISSVAAIIFLSSFVNSSISYQGNNGLITGTILNDSNLSFSSINLRLDNFSSFITPSSSITVDVYPTYQFDTLTTGSITSKAIPMSTFVQYGTRYLSTFHQTQVIGSSAQLGYSNFYQQPMKIFIPGHQVTGAYINPYVLNHFLPGGISYQLNVGFRSAGINIFYGSTNSYFLSVQNMSL
jgi:hypothetical protein